MGFSNWRLFYVGLGDIWPRAPVDTRSDTKDPPTVNAQNGYICRHRLTRRCLVKLLGRENGQLHVRGVDMLDGTPILDIKPYLSSIPVETLHRGWLAEAEARKG
jgi:hypothetical protein